MIKIRFITGVLFTTIALGAGHVRAQSQILTQKSSGKSPGPFANLLNQPARIGGRATSMFNIFPTSSGPTLPVLGGGTVGRLTKWTGFTSSNSFIGETTIFEDKNGLVGIGTDSPTSKLTVAGTIQSLSGGFKFPDGTVQMTALSPTQVVTSLNGLTGNVMLAPGDNITVTPSGNTLTIAAPNSLTSITHNATLTGNGSAISPLGVASPLSVHDLDNPARQPVTFELTDRDQRFAVPAGKMLVIEYVSGEYFVPTAPDLPSVDSLLVLTTSTGNALAIHNVLSYKGRVMSGETKYSVGQLVRIYANGGTNVFAQLELVEPFVIFCSGHYIDVP